ncbi:hypothetical protein ACYSNM_08555 [Myroides sp. LJL116]
MKKYVNLFILVILDFIILWFLIKWLSPDSSTSIALVYLIPITVIINLFIVAILYSMKVKKGIIGLFLINSVLCALLTFILFTVVVNIDQDKQQRSILEQYRFEVEKETYEIKYFRKDKIFEVNKRVNQHFTVKVMSGNVDSINGELKLRDNTILITIKDGRVYGFQENESYKLEKLY